MLILGSTSDVLRVVTGSAAQIEVHASWVDLNGSTVTPGRTNTPHITTATTTTVVASPAASTVRNVKHLNITNDHASASCVVTVEHTDGTTVIELMAFTLLPGENMILNEEGRWTHRDAQGAEYLPSGKGAYATKSTSFYKVGTAADAAGYYLTTALAPGSHGPWSPGTPGVNGRTCDGQSAADVGCLPVYPPGTGTNYLTRVILVGSVVHVHDIFDVLWVNTGLSVTTTTAQAFTVPTLPSRDFNNSSDGLECRIGILCTSAVGLAAVASNATITYVNSDGVGGRTATLAAVTGSQAPQTPVVGTIIWFNLQAGDKGVRGGSWALTLGTSWVSGTISVIIARMITKAAPFNTFVGADVKPEYPGIALHPNVCLLHQYLASATTATYIGGEIQVTER